jgi:hypothetical protein
MLKNKRCQAGHAKRGGGWILFFRPSDEKQYRQCLNIGSVKVNNEDYTPERGVDAVISLCAECNRTSLG